MHGLPDFEDPLFSVWRLGWVHHKLTGDPSPLFSPNIYHPQPQTLAYSDAMLLPALTTAPLLALGAHPVVAYNVILLFSFVLTAWTTYLLVERLTGSPGAAFVSGLLFGYYTPHMYLSLWHWARLVNRYSGHAPHGYGRFHAAMLAFPDDATMAALRERGVTHVTVNCALFRKECDTFDRADRPTAGPPPRSFRDLGETTGPAI